MYLQDAKIIDLNFSKLAIDEEITKLQKSKDEKSKGLLVKAEKEKERQKKNGAYEFIEKRYVDFLSKKQSRPPYWFTWCRYEKGNNYLELTSWKAKWNYTTVNISTDNYCPDGIVPNAEGNFVFGDLILVKCPLIDHLRRRKLEVDMSKGGAKAKLEKFHSDMGKAGAAIPDADMEEMLGELL